MTSAGDGGERIVASVPAAQRLPRSLPWAKLSAARLATSLRMHRAPERTDMPKIRWILAATALLLVASACGSAAASGARYSVRSWEPEPGGLPQNSVIAMTQGGDGYLWLGTLDGIVRFDGNRFATFNDNNTRGLSSSRIFFLFEDSQSNLWIGTENAGIFLVKNGIVTRVPPDKNFHAGKLKSACEDATGAVWLYTDDGQLLHYRNRRVEAGNVGTNLSNCHIVIAEKSGAIWLGNNQGLFTTGTNTDLSTTGPPALRINSVRQVDYLVASAGGGFWCLADGHIQKWRDFHLERDYGPYPWNTPVMCACEDREGNLVVGTLGSGIFWGRPNGQFQQLTRAGGVLSEDSILSVAVDRDDGLWVGTGGFGLNRVKRSPFEVTDEGRTVKSIFEDEQGGMWVGIYAGGTNASLIYSRQGQHRELGSGELVNSVFVDRNARIWAAITGPWPDYRQLITGGLFEVTTNSIQLQSAVLSLPEGVTEFLPIKGVSAIYQDRADVLWVGGEEGLWRLDGDKWKLQTTTDGLSSDDVRSIADDAAGNLWIGTDDAGLNRYRDGHFVSFHQQDGLPSEHISSLYQDGQGVLWVGTHGGLARFEKGRWTRYTTADGLASDSVGYMVEDGQGCLWLGSYLGLMRIPKKALNDFAQGLTNSVSCRTFGKSDGLPTGECTFGSQPAACRSRDGRLWFPTIDGLVTVDPAAIKPNTNPPPVVIESVMIEGVPQFPQTLGAAPPADVTVPAGREQLDIQYTSLNLAAAEMTRFRYRMEPYETKWVEAGDRRVAPYPNLPPGKYLFRVTACNEDDVWNDYPATLAITVLPPFWRKPWFLATAALCLLAMIVGVVHYASTQRLQRQLAGLRQQQALEKERARIARDIHDQLGASLTQVSLLGEMVESDKNSPDEVAAHARQISQTSRDTARALDEIVWTVNPSNDTLEGLVNYVCKYAQEYLAVAGLRYRLDVPSQLPPVIITPEVRHNVFLAAKEAVTNIVRHARANGAHIRLRLEPASFTLEIQDDGRGIPDVAEKLAGSRNGLRNMVKRMEDIGGRFSVRSAPEGGTIISLTVPIHNP
jgi:ligand-binding sensor domain-containing protein/signal transduction histidine kinase